MIYGIEQTTDVRYPETKVVKFTSRKRALAWVAEDQGFAWSGAARNDIPVSQQNWHRRLRELYEVSERNPGKTHWQQLRREHYRNSTRPYSATDYEARWIREVGDEIG